MPKFQYLPYIVFRTPLKPQKAKEQLDFHTDKNLTEALYIASPSLLEESRKQHSDPTKQTKLTASLYKYKSRLTHRCTPFGLFAGVGIAKWSDENRIIIHNKFSRRTSLDMNVLCGISDYISRQEKYIPYFTLFPNKSIYQISEGLRYVEFFYKNNNRYHQLSSIVSNEYLDAILEKCRSGAGMEDLAVLINERYQIAKDEIYNYITQLVQAQILVNEFEPWVTGVEGFSEILLERVNRLFLKTQDKELETIIEALTKINKALREIDNTIGNEITHYEKIKEWLEELKIPFNQKDLFQVDLSYNTLVNGVSDKIQDKLTHTINALVRLNTTQDDSKLSKFKKNYYDRYEDRAMPLLQVLDNESGIGYPEKDSSGINPLVENLHISNQKLVSKFEWSQKEEFLFALLKEACLKQSYCISISSSQITDKFPENKSNFSDTIYAMFSVLNCTTDKIYFQFAGGSSAACLLGRFGIANTEIKEMLFEISQYEQEQNNDKIIAEIVHLPENRTGNILYRPQFRKYEIPYLAQSSVVQDYQIDLSDVLIFIQDDVIKLYSKKLKKEIIPKLSNAHNYSFNSLPVYQFLCDLQSQKLTQHIAFNWGIMAKQFTFLPRVEIDGIIVFAATWQLKKNTWEKLKQKNIDLLLEANLFLSQYKLPENVLLVDGDNELLINFRSKEGILAFIDIIKNQNEITLKEFLFDQKDCLIKNQKEEAHTNECVAIIKTNNINKDSIYFKEFQKSRPTFFLPGNEWVYYKIYTGVKIADTIITNNLLPLIEELQFQQHIKKWFFIRYDDPENHIRVRLNINEGKDVAYIIQKFNLLFDVLIENSSISKIIIDTYSPELERYGANNISNSEDIFFLDSKSTAQFLCSTDKPNFQELRWLWGLKNIDTYLEDFGLQLEDKCLMTETARNNLGKEFNFGKELKLQLDQKYRDNKKRIFDVIEAGEFYFQNNEVFSILRERSADMKPMINLILTHEKGKRLNNTFKNLLFSYMHMSLNRLFMGEQRLNEFVVYDFLNRHYTSMLARKVKK
ncbi:MAG TPA: lantibiotic dehydratase [Bacteroidia bacterium]|jgi:thiopeptide-type bacteriocin biosynthesis protein|nr:lantibiotic dehydratase [Bacteroidia bacterium]